MVFNSHFFYSEPEEQQSNLLLQYLQQQQPEMLEEIAQAATPDIKQIISQNVQGLVGMLGSEEFNVQITTDRENMANLLASAMMTGYFLRRMEQRMELDNTLDDSGFLNEQPPQPGEW
ncbi:MAG: DUF760 domain-containing protein [Cyanobacteriota bacterium]|nr:DUF760 domain-containing protein [Cyanobacteriota bacterium]